MPSTIQWKTLSRGLQTTTECPRLFPCLARNPCLHRSPTKFEDGMDHLLSPSLILIHTLYVRSFTVTIYLSVCHTSPCSSHHLSSLVSRLSSPVAVSFCCSLCSFSFELGIASAEPASPSEVKGLQPTRYSPSTVRPCHTAHTVTPRNNHE